MENRFVALFDKNNKDCDGCATCVLYCPQEAMEIEYEPPGKVWPKINPKKCTGCGVCVKKCSAHALTLVLKGEVRARIIWWYQRRKIMTNNQRRKGR